MTEELLYKSKRSKILPIIIFAILISVSTAMFNIFKDMFPDWAIYALPVFHLYFFMIVMVISRGSIEVTNERFIYKSKDKIIEEVRIEDIVDFHLTTEKSVVSGPTRGYSVSFYINITDNQGNKIKIDHTGYPTKEIKEIASYIESRI